MSRAFVKEDVDPPERSRRARSVSGLPPGAVNYITAPGAARLRKERDELRRQGKDVADLEHTLASLVVVDAPDDARTVAFGAQISVRDAAGQVRTYRVVGVDEARFYEDAVTWVSPTGKALLAADTGEWVTLESGERVQIVGAEYPQA